MEVPHVLFAISSQVASLMDKYAEYLDDADEDSGESTKMMQEAMSQTQVRYNTVRHTSLHSSYLVPGSQG